VKIREREKENTTEREIDNFRDSRYFVCWSISEGLTRERRREKENKREGERERERERENCERPLLPCMQVDFRGANSREKETEREKKRDREKCV